MTAQTTTPKLKKRKNSFRVLLAGAPSLPSFFNQCANKVIEASDDLQMSSFHFPDNILMPAAGVSVAFQRAREL